MYGGCLKTVTACRVAPALRRHSAVREKNTIRQSKRRFCLHTRQEIAALPHRSYYWDVASKGKMAQEDSCRQKTSRILWPFQGVWPPYYSPWIITLTSPSRTGSGSFTMIGCKNVITHSSCPRRASLSQLVELILEAWRRVLNSGRACIPEMCSVKRAMARRQQQRN